ncbi:hypothetical protein ACFQDG_13525 [Natronoarchaeum mannanilyticum]|uniref:Uncharacterized protein n=1 Tax=Natronoarchaeum mannanilyticum TaxID=926360 RepID=A0AAV3T8Z6_9EURY
MLERAPETFRSVDRYLREHALAYAATLFVVTALVWAITGTALGDAPGTAAIEGVAFGVTFAAVTLVGRRVISTSE